METLLAQCPTLDAQRRIPLRSAHRLVHGGTNISLPVTWSRPPEGTQSIVVTIIDEHPIARHWVHWCIAAIPPTILGLPEGASLQTRLLPAGALETINSYGEPGYGGPAPPGGSGPHEYITSVFALSGVPSFKRAAYTKRQIDDLLRGMIIAAGSCTGIFERP